MNRHNQYPFFRRVARSAGQRLFHWAENNGNVAFDSNGEGWLLKTLAARWRYVTERPVVFDVGGNAGDYTSAVLAAAGDQHVQVHIFEPALVCQERLRLRYFDLPSVHIVHSGVAETSGRRRLHTDAPGSTHASLVLRPGTGDSAGETVDVVRLDEYLDTTGLTQVDLIKLDVEGAELAALTGLGERLRPDVVHAVQFEYGGATLDANATLRELFDLLESRGYHLAKLLPRALNFRRYQPWMEHFNYANYVAIGNQVFKDGKATPPVPVS